jgi:hypothetical protein
MEAGMEILVAMNPWRLLTQRIARWTSNWLSDREVVLIVDESVHSIPLGTIFKGVIDNVLATTIIYSNVAIPRQASQAVLLRLYSPLVIGSTSFENLVLVPRHTGGFRRLLLTKWAAVYVFVLGAGDTPDVVNERDIIGIWTLKL